MTVVAVRHPERLADTIAAVYHASFAEQKEVHTPENIMPIFEKIFGEVGTKEILEEVGIKIARIIFQANIEMIVVNK